MSEQDEDLTQYPDAIDDESRHREPEVGQPGADDQDLFAALSPLPGACTDDDCEICGEQQ